MHNFYASWEKIEKFWDPVTIRADIPAINDNKFLVQYNLNSSSAQDWETTVFGSRENIKNYDQSPWVEELANEAIVYKISFKYHTQFGPIWRYALKYLDGQYCPDHWSGKGGGLKFIWLRAIPFVGFGLRWSRISQDFSEGMIALKKKGKAYSEVWRIVRLLIFQWVASAFMQSLANVFYPATPIWKKWNYGGFGKSWFADFSDHREAKSISYHDQLYGM